MSKPYKHTWEDGPPPMGMELTVLSAWLVVGGLMWWGGYHAVAWLWGLATS